MSLKQPEGICHEGKQDQLGRSRPSTGNGGLVLEEHWRSTKLHAPRCTSSLSSAPALLRCTKKRGPSPLEPSVQAAGRLAGR